MTHLTEARCLFAAGIKLVPLKHHLKQPDGIRWQKNPVKEIEESRTGYGMLLAANGFCSIDPDEEECTRVGLAAWGFNLDKLMEAGVRTTSTRPGSGGRSLFTDQADLRWLKLRVNNDSGDPVIVLELRAESTNLQDCVPGVKYKVKGSNKLYTQSYGNGKTFTDAAKLPEKFAKFWQRLSTDEEFRREQEHIFQRAIIDAGLATEAPPFVPNGGGRLPYKSDWRERFNKAVRVEEILAEHGYNDHGSGRWSHPSATGGPGIRAIPNKDGLWHTDHGGDSLPKTFDAWVAYVTLEHDGDLKAAETGAQQVLITSVFDDFSVEEDDTAKSKKAEFKLVIDMPTTEKEREWPAELLKTPGGLVGDIADYTVRSANTPQPALALMAGLCAVSALSANRYEVERWGTRLNIFAIGVLDTGGGKDRPGRVINEVTSFNHSVTVANDSASGAALITALGDNGRVMLWKDEVHAMFDSINDRNGSPHMKDLGNTLLGLYSSAGSTYHGKFYADRKKNIKSIKEPYVVFTGCTTPQRLGEALSDRQVTDGILNRLLVFIADELPDDVIPEQSEMPDSLKDAIKAFLEPVESDPFSEGFVGVDPIKIAVGDDAAELFKQFGRECKAKQRTRQTLSPLWARGLENALKVAGIIAVGIDSSEPAITSDTAKWSIALIQFCLERTTRFLEQNLVSSEFERNCNRAHTLILEARRYTGDAQFQKWCRKGFMPRGKLMKLMKIKSREVDDVVIYLLEAGQIIQKKEPLRKGAKPTCLYQAVRFEK